MFEAGQFAIAVTDRRIGIKDVAKLSYTLRDPALGGRFGFAEKTIAAPKAATFPNGCHVCEVEIDPDTGVVAVVGYTAVDDVGTIVHETVVDGQTHGGIAQGLGQVLGEHVRYGNDGQLLNASLMDYTLPRAANMPVMATAHHSVPCTTNPLGVKGAGESGVAGALPAGMNAVLDALAQQGIEHFDLPASPQRVWDALRQSA